MAGKVVDLHIKYRPKQLKNLIGQSEITSSLLNLLNSKCPHSFLFIGNSGTGKTTTARILASELNCESHNIIEIDAATNSSVENMRDLIESVRYPSFNISCKNKILIIDEAHRLSKQAWESMLKIIEEPPDYLYFVFCTTEQHKVPKSIKTRCHSYNFKDVKTEELINLLSFVAKEEKIQLDQKSIKTIAKASEGSPRQALVYLSLTSSCKNNDEVSEAILNESSNSDIIDLCRILYKNLKTDVKWSDVRLILNKLKDQEPESIRLTVLSYFTSCILNENSSSMVGRILEVIDVFTYKHNSGEKLSPIVLAVGRLLFDGEN